MKCNRKPHRGVQTFGISGPHWKKKSCLGPHVKYANTNKNWWTITKKVLSKFTILSWAAFTAILGFMQSAGHMLDTPVRECGGGEPVLTDVNHFRYHVVPRVGGTAVTAWADSALCPPLSLGACTFYILSLVPLCQLLVLVFHVLREFTDLIFQWANLILLQCPILCSYWCNLGLRPCAFIHRITDFLKLSAKFSSSLFYLVPRVQDIFYLLKTILLGFFPLFTKRRTTAHEEKLEKTDKQNEDNGK